MISVPVANYTELQTILKDLEGNMSTLTALGALIRDNDVERLKKAKKHYEDQGEDWEYIKTLAETGRFPVSAVVIEELSIVSAWIQDELEEELNKQLGTDKSNMG